MGALIEVLAEKKLEDYMKENLFEPLGIKKLFWYSKRRKKLSKMAARYIYDENKKPKKLPLECIYNLSDEYQSGGAGLTSSV